MSIKPDVYKRRWTLAKAVTCPKCNHSGDVVTVMPAGPHRKALCIKCSAYIKFLSPSEGAKMRKPGEDRAALAKTVFIGWAVKGSLLVPVACSANRSKVEKEVNRVRGASDSVGIDRLDPDPYDAPLNATREAA